jgi:hypothetical protein
VIRHGLDRPRIVSRSLRQKPSQSCFVDSVLAGASYAPHRHVDGVHVGDAVPSSTGFRQASAACTSVANSAQGSSSSSTMRLYGAAHAGGGGGRATGSGCVLREVKVCSRAPSRAPGFDLPDTREGALYRGDPSRASSAAGAEACTREVFPQGAFGPCARDTREVPLAVRRAGGLCPWWCELARREAPRQAHP